MDSGRHYLGELATRRGDLVEAEALLRAAQGSRERRQGRRHLTTVSTLEALASLDETRGETARAIELLREVAQARREILGTSHPETVRVEDQLARLLATGTSQQAPSKDLR